MFEAIGSAPNGMIVDGSPSTGSGTLARVEATASSKGAAPPHATDPSRLPPNARSNSRRRSPTCYMSMTAATSSSIWGGFEASEMPKKSVSETISETAPVSMPNGIE